MKIVYGNKNISKNKSIIMQFLSIGKNPIDEYSIMVEKTSASGQRIVFSISSRWNCTITC